MMKNRTVLLMLLIIVAVLLSLFFSISRADAASVTLQWDPNDPTPDGYRLFMRTDGAEYNFKTPVWEGTATTTTVDGLLPATLYYFVVRAFVADDESGDSNEVNYKPEIPAPQNLRLSQEIAVYVDENGKVTLISRLTNVIKP